MLCILLLGIHVLDLPSPDTAFDTDLLKPLITSTELAGHVVPDRVKSILTSTFTNLADNDTFYAAQKEVLNAILKLLSQSLLEVLNFEVNDIYVASLLLNILHHKFAGCVQKILRP